MKSKIIGFQDIYKTYSDDVLRYAYSLCLNLDDAKDITSETFIKLWAVKDTLIVETLRAYIFKIARNTFLQRVRSNKNHSPLHEFIPDSTPLADELLENESHINTVLQAIHQLNDTDKSILLMKMNGDLSYKEIASILEISVSAAKVKVHRARVKLAAMLEAKGELK